LVANEKTSMNLCKSDIENSKCDIIIISVKCLASNKL